MANTFSFFSYTLVGSGFMKPVIGIVMRKEVNENGRPILGLYKEVSDAIYACGGVVLAIVPPHFDTLCEEERQCLHQVIDLCDGIVLEGGDDFYDYDLDICRYVYEKDIPTLGICLGMQTMACLFDGTLVPVLEDSHYKQNLFYAHDIDIVKPSYLYDILGKENIRVNSRHHFHVKGTTLFVSAYHEDIVEACEDSSRKFFVGVQYHPEDMITYDTLEKRLFEKFLDVCRGD